jgi:hypothetical protein
LILLSECFVISTIVSPYSQKLPKGVAKTETMQSLASGLGVSGIRSETSDAAAAVGGQSLEIGRMSTLNYKNVMTEMSDEYHES